MASLVKQPVADSTPASSHSVEAVANYAVNSSGKLGVAAVLLPKIDQQYCYKDEFLLTSLKINAKQYITISISF